MSAAALLDGLSVTLGLLAVSVPTGFALALFAALARLSRLRVLTWSARTYGALFRGTPLLVQIFLIYYGLAQFTAIRHSFLWPILRHPWSCLAIAFTLSLGAYAAEVIRASLLAVPRGESEAAIALGLTPAARFGHVVLPRAIRLGLPALVNELLVQLKSTALASTVTVLDLTGVARRAAAAQFSADPLLEAGLVYACLAGLISLAGIATERLLAPRLS